MGRVFKIIGITVAAGLLLLVAGIVALVTLVDPNNYKSRIAEVVQQHTGRTVEFTGDISLSFFPWLGLEVEGMRIGNPESFGGGDFASLKGAGVHLKLMPLFKREVEVSTITVDGLALNLVRNADGSVNWEFAPATVQDLPAESPPSAPMDGDGFADSTKAAPLAALLVESVSITDASVRYTDHTAKTEYAARNLSLTTSAISPGKPVDIALKTDFSSTAPALEAKLDLGLALHLAHDFTRAGVQNMRLALDAKGETLPGGALSLRQQGTVDCDLMTQICAISDFSLSAYETSINTSGSLNLAEGPAYTGQMSIAGALRKTLAALGTQVETADPKALETLSVAFGLATSPASIELSGIKGRLDDTDFSGDLRIRQFARPDIKTALNVSSLNLNRYLPPEPAAGQTPPPAPASASKDSQPAVQGIPPETRQALRTLLLDATFTVGSLTVQKVALTDITVKATAKDGLIRVNPLSARLFDGRVDADITADLRGAVTRSALSYAVKDVQLDPLTTTLMGERRASGTAAAASSLTAEGETWPAIRSTLNGNGSFAVTDGAVFGFQIIPEGAKSHLAGTSADRVDETTRRQTFERLSASYVARAGRITNNDLALVSPNLNGEGAGVVDLPRDKIDYKATIRVTGLPPLPVTVTGTLANPRYGFDAGAFLQNTLKGVQNLLPIPGLSGGDNGTQGSGSQQGNPLEQLGKGLQQMFKK